MCGRFVRSFTTQELVDDLRQMLPVLTELDSHDFEPDYNVAPTTLIPMVRPSQSGCKLSSAHWGFQFVQHAEEQRNNRSLVINARVETLQDKPMFRHLLKENRCLVPMDGFYEWKRNSSNSIPYFIHRKDRKRMWVAALWRTDTNSSVGNTRRSLVLLTRDATKDVAHIHDRCPVSLGLEDGVKWLQESDYARLISYFQLNGSITQFESWTVGPSVNSVRNNSPRLMEPFEYSKVQSLFDDLL